MAARNRRVRDYGLQHSRYRIPHLGLLQIRIDVTLSTVQALATTKPRRRAAIKPLEQTGGSVEWRVREETGVLEPVHLDESGALTDRPVPFWPQPGPQTYFFNCGLYDILFAGGRGSGKSMAMLGYVLNFIGRGFGRAWLGMIVRREMDDLRDLVEKSEQIFPVAFPNARLVRSPKPEWRFPDGERLIFRQIERPADAHGVQGWGLSFIGVDELGQYPDPKIIDVMHASIRPKIEPSLLAIPESETHFIATANPGGAGNNWIRNRYQLKRYGASDIPGAKSIGPVIQIPGKEGTKPLYRTSIHGNYDSNKVLGHNQSGYINKILLSTETDTVLRMAWVEGRWDLPSGGIFDSLFDPKLHIVDPFSIPSSWRLDRSFDPGDTSPYSVLFWAESDGTDYVDAFGNRRSTVRGDLFLFSEIFGCQANDPSKGVEEPSTVIAEKIRRRELDLGIFGRVKDGPADTALGRSHEASSSAAIMARPLNIDGRPIPGVTWTSADKSPGSRAKGWSAIRNRLHASKPNEHGFRENPGIFVMSHCEHWIRDVPVLRRHEKNPAGGDIQDGQNDHAADATRYRIWDRAAELTVSNY